METHLTSGLLWHMNNNLSNKMKCLFGHHIHTIAVGILVGIRPNTPPYPAQICEVCRKSLRMDKGITLLGRTAFEILEETYNRLTISSPEGIPLDLWVAWWGKEHE